MPLIMENCQSDREKWLSLKKGKVGASLAYHAGDVDDNAHPFEAWLQLTGQKEPLEDNDWMFWGRMFERGVIEGFCRKYVEDHPGSTVEIVGGDFLVQHPKHDWAVATPDFLVAINGEVVNVQTKTRSASRYAEYDDEAGVIPNEDRAQVLHEMGCMEDCYAGLARSILAAFFYPETGKNYRPPTLKYVNVPREQGFIDELFKREERTVLLAKAGVPPDLKPGASGEQIRAAFWTPQGEVIDLSNDPNALRYAKEYLSAREQAKHFNALKEEAALELLKLGGDGKRIHLDGAHKVTIVRKETTLLDSKACAAELEALKKKYPKKSRSVYPLVYGPEDNG